MGSSLSPVVAGLYMEFFESELLPSLPHVPLLWLRYVDDVFAVVERDFPLEEFLQNLNSLTPTINFTVEAEQDAKLPFLDTCVHRDHETFSFSVYRKPTHSNMLLHYFSSNPKSVKRSVVFSMFLRAYRICSPAFLNSEIDYLYQAFSKLAYPNYFVKKIHGDVKRKVYATVQDSPPETQDFKPTLSIPFNSFSNSAMNSILRSQNISVAHSSSNTLCSQLMRTRPKQP